MSQKGITQPFQGLSLPTIADGSLEPEVSNINTDLCQSLWGARGRERRRNPFPSALLMSFPSAIVIFLLSQMVWKVPGK